MLVLRVMLSGWGERKTEHVRQTGRVRPVLEYGMAAWGTTDETNMDKMSKVQNQAARIITGSMRSTPIQELETITGLLPLLDRCHEKLLTQAAKFKMLRGHPMKKKCISQREEDYREKTLSTKADVLKKDTETFWNKTPRRFSSALRSMPGAKKDISLSKAAYQE